MNRTYHPRGELVHGYKVENHPLYDIWANMLSRCYCPSGANYIYYGARGISVCKRWHHFRNFAKDMWPRPERLTLERIDVNGNYTPSNCKWASCSDQCLNRRKFKNNTSGVTGVRKHNNSWVVNFNYENKRYALGWFETKDQAIQTRRKFVKWFKRNKDAAINSLKALKYKARYTSSTGIRGITPHIGGGYTVRLTISKKRIYIGYFKILKEAINARQKFIARTAQNAQKRTPTN